MQVGAGNTEVFTSRYIEKKYCNITIYHDIFCIFKLRVIMLNKEIPNVDGLYLKLKSKYGLLLGYKFHQKFDDFYSSLCKKQL